MRIDLFIFAFDWSVRELFSENWFYRRIGYHVNQTMYVGSIKSFVMAEETSPRELATPSKSSNLPVLTTPTGGRLYNPFHEDYVAHLDEATVTPGLFVPPNRFASRSEAAKPIPFVWSPEIKGDHFPTEIDENPTYQLQMQQKLDADVEEAAQSKITKYFQSNIIAPSPDVSRKPFTVEVQTSMSVAPDTDLPSLLQKAIGLEEKENVVCGGEGSNLYQCGVIFSEASAERTEDSYLRYPSAICPSCLRGNLPSFRKRRSLFAESFDMDTVKDVAASPDDTRSIHDTQFVSAEDMEAMADDLGLPVNWASESISLSSRCQNKRSPKDVDRFNQSGNTNLTGLLEHAGIGSCRTPSCGPKKSHLFEPVSPLVGGRTSPEGRGLQRPLPLSFTMDDEDDKYDGGDGGDEESTRDSCKPLKRQCSDESRKRGMASPNLSPIYHPCGNSLMDQDDGNYVDVDALPGTVVDADDDNKGSESAP
ncbi:hypothetical protein EGR_00101 [Echinococcus granulosus]|uniref:Protein aurora borealis n=1 Tax=Echinococcus granulosus TaxID=6210 RepID=W6V1L3_ECHGR|nr:hypothetical protein EGR_00101 [Echinococcus granulosus]EUB64832.1 hypothetical protein EGR_00101 [Echinococcus granulosus]